jgi:hypothetical protein
MDAIKATDQTGNAHGWVMTDERVRERERWAWLAQWIASNGQADCLDQRLVRQFAERFGARLTGDPGAERCPLLGTTLSDMHRRGAYVKKSIRAVGRQPGTPRWCFFYTSSERTPLLITGQSR